MMSTILAAQRALNRERILLELHRHGSFQRIALSERLELRTNSVGSICAELLEWGLIRELGGSPANQLQLAADDPFFAAVYIGVRRVMVARVQFGGTVTVCEEFAYHPKRKPSDILNDLTKCLKAACGKRKKFLCGIGVTIPGLVDSEQGIVRYAANLPGWQEIEIRARLQRDFPRLVLVENEVRCHLWEELWFRRREEVLSTIVYLLIIEGLGCAVLAGGRLVSGHHCAAGEIGHVSCDQQGRACSCGKRGCLEAYCSESALLKDAAELNLAPPPGEGLGAVLARLPHDARLNLLIDRAMEKLAAGIAPLLGALDPAELIVGCRTRALAQALGSSLRHRLRDKLMGLPACDLPVTATQAAEETALRGVAGFLMQRYFREVGALSVEAGGNAPVILPAPV